MLGVLRQIRLRRILVAALHLDAAVSSAASARCLERRPVSALYSDVARCYPGPLPTGRSRRQSPALAPPNPADHRDDHLPPRPAPGTAAPKDDRELQPPRSLPARRPPLPARALALRGRVPVAAVRAAVAALERPVVAVPPLGLRPAHDAVGVGLAVERDLAAAAARRPTAATGASGRRRVRALGAAGRVR